MNDTDGCKGVIGVQESYCPDTEALEEAFFSDLFESYKAMMKEYVLFKMGHPEAINKVLACKAHNERRKQQLEKLIEDQRNIAVCPFCSGHRKDLSSYKLYP